MSRQNAAVLTQPAVAMCIVIAIASVAAGGQANWSAEGTWIIVMTTPAGNITFTQTCTPLDAPPTRFSSVMQQVTENPTYFGMFPEADRGTDWSGHVVQVDPQTYEGTFVGYLTRLVGQGEGQFPLAETVAILVLSATWELTSPNASAGEIAVAVYRADQDADRDGLPDDSQEPLDCSTFSCTAKRLGLIPACRPGPAPDSEKIALSVTVGEDFVISLESNPTTGYSWELTSSLPTWLELVGSEYKPSQTDPMIVGSGGIEEWTFRANEEGTATITFEYRRPWEEGQPAAERKTFVITARAAGDVINVAVGVDFVISLGGNYTTGYMWVLTSPLPPWLTFVGSVYEPTDPSKIGGGGVDKWTFRATDEGTATMTFEYRQPWMPDDPPAQRKTFTIIARFRGETMEVTVGEEFVISLAANHSAGYEWELASEPPPWLQYVGCVYELTNPGKIGGGGIEKWTFKAIDEGTASITLEYRRPWLPDDPPVDQKTITVIARS